MYRGLSTLQVKKRNISSRLAPSGYEMWRGILVFYRQSQCKASKKLLLLNHVRHEEEVKVGLFEIKGKGAKKGSIGKGGRSGEMGVSDGGVELEALF